MDQFRLANNFIEEIKYVWTKATENRGTASNKMILVKQWPRNFAFLFKNFDPFMR